MTYNSMLVSGIQQSDSVILFSIMVYYRILNMVSCAIQEDLVVYHSVYNSLHLVTLKSNSLSLLYPLPQVTAVLLSVSVSLFLFMFFNKFICVVV